MVSNSFSQSVQQYVCQLQYVYFTNEDCTLVNTRQKMLFEGKIGECTTMKNFQNQNIYFKIMECDHKKSYKFA